jgi:aspartyl-tRNA synthetase
MGESLQSANAGDLILMLSGDLDKVRNQLNELRLHMGSALDLARSQEFQAPLGG